MSLEAFLTTEHVTCYSSNASWETAIVNSLSWSSWKQPEQCPGWYFMARGTDLSQNFYYLLPKCWIFSLRSQFDLSWKNSVPRTCCSLAIYIAINSAGL